MNYLSVCSGIEAATVGWHHMGWKPIAFSEIEKFPSEVLNHHYPDVPNLGDMTKFKEWELNESIDILVGGTPCQSFSVAGLRKGLEDPRGNLALTYVAILNKFRPKWCIWENVPGVLSSGKGKDFGSFLGALVELGYGFAYRVLDAQYFGVAQRRRRVFVVGCSSGWELAAKVLFESESLRRNIKKSKSERKEIAGTITARFGNSRNNHEELAPTLTSSYGKSSGQDMQPGLIHPVYSSEKSATLTSSAAGFSRPGGSSTSHENYIAQTITFPADMNFFSGFDNNISNTLLRKGNMAIALAENTIGRKPENGGNGDGYSEELSYTLNATGVHGVATIADKAGTLRANPGSGFRSNGSPVEGVAIQNMAVRRLTPIECERLQGFPDGYTDIKQNCPDGPRYKALGNSMAVPVMRWIGERINKVNEL